LLDLGPDSNQRRRLLGGTDFGIGILLAASWTTDPAMTTFQRTVETLTRLAVENPAVTDIRSRLAASHNYLGIVLSRTGRPAETEAKHGETLPIPDTPAEEDRGQTWIAFSLVIGGKTRIGIGGEPSIRAVPDRFDREHDDPDLGFDANRNLVPDDTRPFSLFAATSQIPASHAPVKDTAGKERRRWGPITPCPGWTAAISGRLTEEHKPCNLPFKSIGILFKGREAFLDDLQQRVDVAGARATDIVNRLAVHGLGGMGKTRAALEDGWSYDDEYTALLFVSASSMIR
jgi:hypothetical protein